MNEMPDVPARAIWSDDEMLECVSVIPEVPNTATFTFRAPSGALFDFLPGQFLTLEIPAPGAVVHRTYTISSSPSRPLSISITAKAQVVGRNALSERCRGPTRPDVILKAMPGACYKAIDDADFPQRSILMRTSI